jgi:hypothetical protein
MKMSIQMSSKVGKGALLAVGAAALILSGCAGTGAKTATSAETVSCLGINSCKGTGACKTAENACKGQNACKGHGILVVTSEDCTSKHGTII